MSQLATVRRHRVDNTWRSQRWQHAMKPRWSEIAIFCLPHLQSTPPLAGGGFLSEYCHDVWYRITRMAWLRDKNLKICLLVLTECTNVTDGQTDGRTPHDGIGRAYIASCGKKRFWHFGELYCDLWLFKVKQELSYRQQIARQLRTQYAEGIYRLKYYTVTLKSRLGVTQGHWKRNHWIGHTRLSSSRFIWRWILLWPWNVG